MALAHGIGNRALVDGDLAHGVGGRLAGIRRMAAAFRLWRRSCPTRAEAVAVDLRIGGDGPVVLAPDLVAELEECMAEGAGVGGGELDLDTNLADYWQD